MDKFTIDAVINYCEQTREEEWMTGVCRSKDQTKNCLLGHIFNMGKDEEESNDLLNWFESCIATDYMFFPVNDGTNPNYQQPTPRLRCLAYLNDLKSGKAKTTLDYMKEYEDEFLLRRNKNEKL